MVQRETVGARLVRFPVGASATTRHFVLERLRTAHTTMCVDASCDAALTLPTLPSGGTRRMRWGCNEVICARFLAANMSL